MNNSFSENGYQIIDRIILPEEIEQLKCNLEKIIAVNPTNNIRGVEKKIPAIKTLANSNEILNLIATFDRSQPKLVRAIYFNKTQNANWFVGWHQDKTIAVREKIITSGFINWTVKKKVPHVQPPVEIMQNILTLRIHLDNTDSSNGALQLIPKTHKFGILDRQQIENLTKIKSSISCDVNTGDILLMSPLILHRSLKNKTTKNRRVIHLEYSSIELPNNLQWID